MGRRPSAPRPPGAGSPCATRACRRPPACCWPCPGTPLPGPLRGEGKQREWVLVQRSGTSHPWSVSVGRAAIDSHSLDRRRRPTSQEHSWRGKLRLCPRLPPSSASTSLLLSRLQKPVLIPPLLSLCSCCAPACDTVPTRPGCTTPGPFLKLTPWPTLRRHVLKALAAVTSPPELLAAEDNVTSSGSSSLRTQNQPLLRSGVLWPEESAEGQLLGTEAQLAGPLAHL